MTRHVSASLALAALVGAGCPGDDDTMPSGDGSSSGGGDDLASTLPITVTFNDMDPVETSSGSASTTSDPDATGSGSDASSSGGGDTTGNGTTGGAESSSGGSGTWDVEWCRLQAPASVTETVGTPFTVYGRLYAAGLTDQTVMTDPDAMLVAEAGWGADGSDPAMAAWTWVDASANLGFDGNDWGEPNNDEYMADVVIDEVGSFDYAFRFSGDGGTTWVYCDLDDLVTGGYTPDQAGDATIE